MISILLNSLICMIGMGKSLMDYNIEQSSSADIKNIKWTQKNPTDPDKPKKKKKKQTSPTNIKIGRAHV